MRADIALGLITVIMAVLGGIVSAQAPTKTWKKVPYVVSFVLAGAASILLIINISNENAAAKIALSISLTNIADSTTKIADMTALNTQLQGRLLHQSDTITDLAEKNIATVTGGESYPEIFVIPAPGEAPNTFRFALSVNGPNTLFDVTYKVNSGHPPYLFNDKELADALAGKGWISLGDVNPKLSMPLNLIHPPENEVSAWTINVNARNGSTSQFLELRFNKDVPCWPQVQSIVRRGKKVLVRRSWQPTRCP